MVHGIETLKRLNDDAAAKIMQDLINDVSKKHHESCYGTDKFEFIWGEIDCPGIWAFGGPIETEEPVFMWARFCVPEKDQKPGWHSYIGPRPEFSNESKVYSGRN